MWREGFIFATSSGWDPKSQLPMISIPKWHWHNRRGEVCLSLQQVWTVCQVTVISNKVKYLHIALFNDIRMMIQVSRQAVSSPSWLLLVFWHMVDFWARLSKILWFVSGEQINDIICQRLRQIIDPLATQKSWYFAITKFNNCFIIQSPLFWSTKCVRSLSACSGNRSAIFTQERSFNYAWAEYYLHQNTYL